jgi:hypothetical protein
MALSPLYLQARTRVVRVELAIVADLAWTRRRLARELA